MKEYKPRLQKYFAYQVNSLPLLCKGQCDCCDCTVQRANAPKTLHCHVAGSTRIGIHLDRRDENPGKHLQTADRSMWTILGHWHSGLALSKVVFGCNILEKSVQH